MKREKEKREPANTITRELFTGSTVEGLSGAERMTDIEEAPADAVNEEAEGKEE